MLALVASLGLLQGDWPQGQLGPGWPRFHYERQVRRRSLTGERFGDPRKVFFCSIELDIVFVKSRILVSFMFVSWSYTMYFLIDFSPPTPRPSTSKAISPVTQTISLEPKRLIIQWQRKHLVCIQPKQGLQRSGETGDTKINNKNKWNTNQLNLVAKH